MKVLFAVVTLLLLVGCSAYNRVLKSDDYVEKYAMADTLYKKERYERCIALYEQVYQRSPKSAEGELSYYRLGKSFYEVEDWYMASYYLAAFTTRFPYSPKCEETAFLAAMCAVANSPEPSLDQNETENALNDLQIFVTKFPESRWVDTCNIVMDKLRFKLETKDVLNIRLYAKTENFRAATVAAESFLESYPISSYREEIAATLLRNSYSLTKNSIDTKLAERIRLTRERYHSFVAEFPESAYLREFDDYPKKLEELEKSSTTRN